MKKRVTVCLLAALVAGAMPLTSFAASTNEISSDRSAKEDGELTGSNAPTLTISSKEDTTEDMFFSLELNNAEWLYEGSGTLENGLTYQVMSDSTMMVQMDGDVFDFANNDIVIPLETRITGVGQATVTIDPKDSTVSAGTYAFAHVNYPAMTIQMKENKDKGTFGLTFEDNYPYSMPKGRLFKLTLSKGYTFDDAKVTVTGTGKYKDLVEFKPFGNDTSIAYVQTTNFTPGSEGTITVEGISYVGSSEEAPVLTIEPVYGQGSSLSYNLSKTEEETTPEMTQKTVLFTVGGNYYVVDGDEMVTMEASPFIDENGRTMLPLRALSNSIGIADKYITWDDESKTVIILADLDGDGTHTDQVSVTVGQKQIDVNGKKIAMDTQAVIQDGYTYLPMRAVLNALGFTDEQIQWSEKDKTVTLTWEEAKAE